MNNGEIIINHILLIFKLLLYKSREIKKRTLYNLLTHTRKYKKNEKTISFDNERALLYEKIWCKTNSKLPVQ